MLKLRVTTLTTLCLLLVASTNSAPDSTNHKTYYLEENCGDLDDIHVESVTTIRLRKDGHQGVKGLSSFEQCKVHISVKPTNSNFTLMVNIRNFHLSERSPQGVCLNHFLQMSDSSKDRQRRMCQRLETFKTDNLRILEDGEVDFYYFRNTPLLPEHDLDITIASVIEPDYLKGCPVTSPPMFECIETHLCIPEALKCDGMSQCRSDQPDGSDERDCPSEREKEEKERNKRPEAIPHPTDDEASKLQRAGDEHRSSSKKKTQIIIIGVCSGILVIGLVAVIAVFVVRKAQRSSTFQEVSTTEPAPEQNANPRVNPREASV